MFKLGLITILTLISWISTNAQEDVQPYFLQQCPRDEEYVNECLRDSGNKLVHYLRQGVPELDVYDIEPVIIDEIGIVLGSGPDGYRALFRNIQAYGVSNINNFHFHFEMFDRKSNKAHKCKGQNRFPLKK